MVGALFFVLLGEQVTRKVCFVKEIREWLGSKGQDYAQGVALYEAHGTSRVVLSALRHGASEFTRQKLKKELEKLVIAGGVTTNVTAAVTAKPVHVIDTSAKRVRETPKSVHVSPPAASELLKSPVKTDKPSDELQLQRRAWFAERNHLHPQLELVTTTAERLAMSLRILELGDLLTQSYAAAPDPDTTQTPVGQVSAAVAEARDAGEMRRLLANLRPQRTKLKKRPDRAPDLAQVELDIKFLEEKLKRDGGEPKLHPGH